MSGGALLYDAAAVPIWVSCQRGQMLIIASLGSAVLSGPMVTLISGIGVGVFLSVGSLLAGREEQGSTGGKKKEQTRLFHGPKVSTAPKTAKLYPS